MPPTTASDRVTWLKKLHISSIPAAFLHYSLAFLLHSCTLFLQHS